MNIFIFISGFLLFAFAIYDLTYTTLAPRGAGILTGKISQWAWGASLKLAGNNGRHGFLNNVGYLLLYIVLFTWILLIWTGNTLMFYSDPFAILNSKNEFVTSFTEKFYYTGFVLSTLGIGDYVPAKNGWHIYTSFLSFNGLIFLTLSISYIIPVINALAEQRALSTYISGLGKNPVDILLNTYNGKDFKDLNEHLSYIHQKVLNLIQNHQAYPVLHYFHSTEIHNSGIINLSAIDESLTILLCTIKKEYWPDKTNLMPLRYTLTAFLQTLNNTFIHINSPTPPIPTPSELEKIKHTLRDHSDWQNEFDQYAERRQLLHSYLRSTGWKWNDMFYADFEMTIFTENKKKG